MRRKHLQFLGAILLVAVPSLAAANRVEVSPPRIELQPSRGSALLQVKNFGAEELRFEILAFSWSQDGTNDMVLEETDDIVFFPAIFSVAPGGSRKIRIASQVPTVDVERAYRLVVKQLPDDVPDGSVTVRILTEFSVPVFVNAPSMEATPLLFVNESSGRRVGFSIRNEGEKRLQPFRIQVSTRDDQGKTLHTGELTGWYILPKQEKRYEFELPESACPKTKRVIVRAEFVDGPVEASAEHSCPP